MTLHLTTIVVLAITSIVRWGINGNSILSANWYAAQPSSAGEIAKQIFFGVSLGFLGNTGMPSGMPANEGFELTPSYAEEVKPRAFPKALRNLWIMSFSQLTLMMLLVWAVVPYSEIQTNSSNILSVLAQNAAQAKWLRYWLVVDAVLVLGAGTTVNSKLT
jgi:hypothetical protein